MWELLGQESKKGDSDSRCGALDKVASVAVGFCVPTLWACCRFTFCGLIAQVIASCPIGISVCWVLYALPSAGTTVLFSTPRVRLHFWSALLWHDALLLYSIRLRKFYSFHGHQPPSYYGSLRRKHPGPTFSYCVCDTQLPKRAMLILSDPSCYHLNWWPVWVKVPQSVTHWLTRSLGVTWRCWIRNLGWDTVIYILIGSPGDSDTHYSWTLTGLGYGLRGSHSVAWVERSIHWLWSLPFQNPLVIVLFFLLMASAWKN